MWKVNFPVLKIHNPVFLVPRLLGILYIVVPMVSLANDCFPSFDKTKLHYIVGYGSLLYEQARKSNDIDFEPEVPVWVDGFRRGWLTRTRQDNQIKVTELGVIPMVGGRFNGVVFSMPISKIKAIDRQQKLTCRVRIKPEQLTPIKHDNIPKGGQFWLYQTLNKYSAKPAASYPILMSDVDEFLTGCIEQSERFKLQPFAGECVATTWNWSSHWVNDRLHPLKAKPAQIRRHQVDKLLENLEGNLYEQIRTE